MFNRLYQLKNKTYVKLTGLLFCVFICCGFQFQSSESVLPYMPGPSELVSTSDCRNPPLLVGLKIDSNNPFKFDFIIDHGDSRLTDEELMQESGRMVKYFLAGLTIPQQDLWVNLSPNEKDLISTASLGLTELGKDMLAQDYSLKQLSASLLFPESELGKQYWREVYRSTYKTYGTVNLPIGTFNKVWITPGQAVIYQNKNTVYLHDARLKVLLEEDYLSLKQNSSIVPQSSMISSRVMRDVVVPVIEEEVNHGDNFSRLRQIYNALILATWFKQNLDQTISAKALNTNSALTAYVDQNKIEGVDVSDSDIKQKIYGQYLKSYKKGVYNYIKKEYDPFAKKPVSRKYFSGGFDFGKKLDSIVSNGTKELNRLTAVKREGRQSVVTVELEISRSVHEWVTQRVRSFPEDRKRSYARTGQESQQAYLERFNRETGLLLHLEEDIGKASERVAEFYGKEPIKNPGYGFVYGKDVYIQKGQEADADLVLHEILEGLARSYDETIYPMAAQEGIGNNLEAFIDRFPMVVPKVASEMESLLNSKDSDEVIEAAYCFRMILPFLPEQERNEGIALIIGLLKNQSYQIKAAVRNTLEKIKDRLGGEQKAKIERALAEQSYRGYLGIETKPRDVKILYSYMAKTPELAALLKAGSRFNLIGVQAPHLSDAAVFNLLLKRENLSNNLIATSDIEPAFMMNWLPTSNFAFYDENGDMIGCYYAGGKAVEDKMVLGGMARYFQDYRESHFLPPDFTVEERPFRKASTAGGFEFIRMDNIEKPDADVTIIVNPKRYLGGSGDKIISNSALRLKAGSYLITGNIHQGGAAVLTLYKAGIRQKFEPVKISVIHKSTMFSVFLKGRTREEASSIYRFIESQISGLPADESYNLQDFSRETLRQLNKKYGVTLENIMKTKLEPHKQSVPDPAMADRNNEGLYGTGIPEAGYTENNFFYLSSVVDAYDRDSILTGLYAFRYFAKFIPPGIRLKILSETVDFLDHDLYTVRSVARSVLSELKDELSRPEKDLVDKGLNSHAYLGYINIFTQPQRLQQMRRYLAGESEFMKKLKSGAVVHDIGIGGPYPVTTAEFHEFNRHINPVNRTIASDVLIPEYMLKTAGGEGFAYFNDKGEMIGCFNSRGMAEKDDCTLLTMVEVFKEYFKSGRLPSGYAVEKNHYQKYASEKGFEVRKASFGRGIAADFTMCFNVLYMYRGREADVIRQMGDDLNPGGIILAGAVGHGGPVIFTVYRKSSDGEIMPLRTVAIIGDYKYELPAGHFTIAEAENFRWDYRDTFQKNRSLSRRDDFAIINALVSNVTDEYGFTLSDLSVFHLDTSERVELKQPVKTADSSPAPADQESMDKSSSPLNVRVPPSWEINILTMSHHTASQSLRENFTFSEKEIPVYLEALKEHNGVREVMILSTCNRTEIVMITDRDTQAEDILLRFHGSFFSPGIPATELRSKVELLSGEDAVKHMIAVTSGLNSMAVGETQIAGQVKNAFMIASNTGTAGPVLEDFLRIVTGANRDIRKEIPSLGQGAMSISALAVKKAKKILGSLEDRTCLLSGAGEVQHETWEHLIQRGVSSINIVSRNQDSVDKLVRHMMAEHTGEGQEITIQTAVHSDSNRFLYLLAQSDILLTATAAGNKPVIKRGTIEQAMKKRGGRDLIIIDMAFPPDVEASVNGLKGIHYFSLEQLEDMVNGEGDILEKGHRLAAMKSKEAWRDWVKGKQENPSQLLLKQIGMKWKDVINAAKESEILRLSPDKHYLVKMLESIQKRKMNNLRSRITRGPPELIQEIMDTIDGFWSGENSFGELNDYQIQLPELIALESGWVRELGDWLSRDKRFNRLTPEEQTYVKRTGGFYIHHLMAEADKEILKLEDSRVRAALGHIELLVKSANNPDKAEYGQGLSEPSGFTPGGIDISNINFRVKGGKVVIPVEQTTIDKNNFSGFSFRIVGLEPIGSLQEFLSSAE